MRLLFENSGWLGPAAILALLAVLLRRWRGGYYSPPRRAAIAALRLAAAAAILFLSLGGRFFRDTGRLRLLVAADISAGAAKKHGGDIEAVAQAVRRRLRGKGDVTLLAFDGRPREARNLAAEAPPSAKADKEADLELALLAGADRFAAGGQNRLLLLTGGEETRGHALRTLPILREKGIKVFAWPFREGAAKKAEIVSLSAPARVFVGQPYEIRAAVRGTGGAAEVTLAQAGRVSDRREVALHGGAETVVFPRREASPGTRIWKVEVSAAEPSSIPDSREAATEVAGGVKVALVTGDPAASAWLAATLKEGGTRVAVIEAESLALEWNRLEEAGVILLDGVDASSLGTLAMERIEALVRERGYGLLAVGGRRSMGTGGWKETALENALPVTMGGPFGAPASEMGLVAVVDTSLSMEFLGETGLPAAAPRKKIEVARQALIAVIRALRPGDQLGILDSADSLIWRREPGPVGDKAALEALVSRLSGIGGGINFYSSVLEARRRARELNTPIRHVMVICDSNDIDQYEVANVGRSFDLIREMEEEGTTLSIFAVGRARDKDVSFLRTAASIGGGEFYQVSRIEYLPQYFISDYENKRETWVREEEFRPLIKEFSAPVRGFEEEELPPLGGLSLTVTRRGAREAILSPFGSPVFAVWKYGKGMTAVFASDDGRRWASAWRGWDKAGLFWAQAVHLVAPRPPQGHFESRVETDGREGMLVVRACNADGSFAEAGPSRLLVGAGESGLSLPLTRTGLDTWTAPGEGVPPGIHPFRLAGDGTEDYGGGMFAVTPPAGKTAPGAGRQLLSALVEGTGGAWLTGVNDLESGLAPERPPLPETTFWICLGAMLLLLGELALRY